MNLHFALHPYLRITMTQLHLDKYQQLRDKMFALINEADDERLEDMEEALWEASQDPPEVQMRKSLQDIKAGRTVSTEEFRALLNELEDEG